jgi:hypothetical protein
MHDATEAGKAMKDILAAASESAQEHPDDNLNFVVVLLGSSTPEDSNMKVDTIIGGQPELLAEGIVTFLENLLTETPDVAVRVAMLIEKTKLSSLAGMKTQGNA